MTAWQKFALVTERTTRGAKTFWKWQMSGRSVNTACAICVCGLIIAGSATPANAECNFSSGASTCVEPPFPEECINEQTRLIEPCDHPSSAPPPSSRPAESSPTNSEPRSSSEQKHREVYFVRVKVYGSVVSQKTTRAWLRGLNTCIASDEYQVYAWSSPAWEDEAHAVLPQSATHIKFLSRRVGDVLTGGLVSQDEANFGQPLGPKTTPLLKVDRTFVSSAHHFGVWAVPLSGCVTIVGAAAADESWAVDLPVAVHYSYKKRVVIGTRTEERVRYV